LLSIDARSVVLKAAAGAQSASPRGPTHTTCVTGGAFVRKNIDVEVEAGVVEKYRRHANGNGWVSGKSNVQPSAFISESAYIESGATVGREAWVGPGSWIDHDAVLGDRVFVGQNVHIGQGSVISGGAHLGSHARIGRDVRIGAGVRLDRDTRVPDGAVLLAGNVGPDGRRSHGLAA
jgi:carbonic anhydrase/acetyltransferase-like protein (isoleucine patch superfamily)